MPSGYAQDFHDRSSRTPKPRAPSGVVSSSGRSLAVSDAKVRRYLDAITSALVVRQLRPWHQNLRKRRAKAPKVYLSDTGILHTLLSQGRGDPFLLDVRGRLVKRGGRRAACPSISSAVARRHSSPLHSQQASVLAPCLQRSRNASSLYWLAGWVGGLVGRMTCWAGRLTDWAGPGRLLSSEPSPWHPSSPCFWRS